MKHYPLGDLSAGEFLRNYWQKQPLLIRGAIADYICPVTPEELAGLACEQEVESRLILEREGDKPWQCRYGPFNEKKFQELPDTHWTLLIQECNKYNHQIALLLDLFNFVPNWRVDDVMVSYAPRYGSVGPHTDQYDVFLLQGLGQRRWQISNQAAPDMETIAGLDISVLKSFQSDEEWILAPGDMLYLPPGVAHFGVALEDCITLSIGFRAPSYADILAGYVDQCLAKLTGEDLELRYKDPGLKTQTNPGQISESALEKIQHIIANEFNQSENINRWFGRFVTEAKQPPLDPLEPQTSVENFLREFSRQGILYRSEYSRFSFLNKQTCYLYIDGEEYSVVSELTALAMYICDHREYYFENLQADLQNGNAANLFCRLFNAGKFVFPDDDA